MVGLVLVPCYAFVDVVDDDTHCSSLEYHPIQAFNADRVLGQIYNGMGFITIARPFCTEITMKATT